MKNLIYLLLLISGLLLADDYEDEVRDRLNKYSGSTIAVDNGSQESEEVISRSGKEVYDIGCAACHTAGLAGSPLLGDQSQWEARLVKGVETLTNNAYNGYNAMPAKGLCMDCSKEEIRASLDYMLEALTVD